MQIPLEYLPHYAYDDWVHWQGRWELVYGRPIAGNPLPTPAHQRVLVVLQVAFGLPLKQLQYRQCKVYGTIDYLIAEDIILQPDMLIVCGKIEKQFLDFPPVLIAEILLPSTILRDRNIKFELYQQQGVKYYLMVDIEKESFELYEFEDGEYRLANYNFDQPFTFTLNDSCTIEVTLNEIWSQQ